MMPPLTLPYEDGDPIPQGYTVKTRASRPLVIAGSITFGAPYVVSALVAATVLSADDRSGPELAPLLIPCVGPFVTIGTAAAEGAGTFWLVLDGLTQTGGVVMFIAGMVSEEKFLRRTAVPPPQQPTALLRPEVLVGLGSTHLKWRF
jgi:hypothetical protein